MGSLQPIQPRTLGRSRSVGIVEGSSVLTPGGYRDIALLRPADLVFTLLARTAVFAPITWIGWRRIGQALTREPGTVCVRQNAIDDDVPVRDVSVAAEQGLYLEGRLFFPRQLVNNASLVMEPLACQVVWAIELPRHDVILVDGLPVESFIDEGNRGAFAEPEAAAIPNLGAYRREGRSAQ